MHASQLLLLRGIAWGKRCCPQQALACKGRLAKLSIACPAIGNW